MDPNTKIRLIRFGVIGFVLIMIALIILVIAQIKMPAIEILPPSENITTNISEYNETQVSEIECNESCIYDRGLQNMTYCAELENETLAESCYEHWANESLDACTKLPVAKREQCILYHANKTKDLTICELAADEAACKVLIEPCYAYTGNARNICLALSRNAAAYCEGDDDCLFNYSITKNDMSACEGIALNAKRVACTSILEDEDHCDELNKSAEQDMCWEIYATTADDKTVCFGISELSEYALGCFSYFAGRTHDPDFCTLGGFELDDLWHCYVNYSLTSGDLEGCDRIHPLATTNRYACYGGYAKIYGNPQACNYLNDTYTLGTRSICYEGAILGNAKLNYTYCGGVTVEKWRNKCYTEYAKLNDDPSVCEYIPTTSERGTCIDAWRVYTNSTEII